MCTSLYGSAARGGSTEMIERGGRGGSGWMSRAPAGEERARLLAQEFLERERDRRQALLRQVNNVPVAHDRQSLHVERRPSPGSAFEPHGMQGQKRNTHFRHHRL